MPNAQVPTSCPECNSLELELPIEVPARFNNGELDFVDGHQALTDYQLIRNQALMVRCLDCDYEWTITL